MEIVKKLVASKSPLRVLNLSGNEISPDAARTIMQLTKGVRTLEQLIIGTNNFGHRFDELRGFRQQTQSEYIDLGEERYAMREGYGRVPDGLSKLCAISAKTRGLSAEARRTTKKMTTGIRALPVTPTGHRKR